MAPTNLFLSVNIIRKGKNKVFQEAAFYKTESVLKTG